MMSEKEPCGCQRESVEEALAALFDAPPTPQECERLREQLSRCPECFSRLEREEAMRALMRGCCGSAPAPMVLRSRISAQIRIVRGEGRRG
ncbi:zf-HC2 domain-containing protein [Corynebacterium sp. zg-331]|uniref:zf-HC2 domain-containing protein n=1 Tax=unclassified Corynebacterium TaxID=2624378 RepID=UPI00128B8C68|nr:MULTISPECIES: zf-HC2 domain-containing protein [unclassified Corynebacterium]MBC3185887.1 zf-HC2 domain-containing protein [Corynebacterium sp. zg-331]MPV52378.1 anti-sigma factor [Corynebacterium sp. zg331]